MSRATSGRAKKVLGRFPRHMEADAPGKLIGSVTQALVRDQDVQAVDMQGIRCAHRLYEAKELHDLLLLAGLHGIRRSEMALLFARHDQARSLLVALKSGNGDAAERQRMATGLLTLWALPGSEPLKLFAPDPAGAAPLSEEDVAAAINRLLPKATASCRTRVLLEGVRRRIAEIAAIHVVGNGTIRALLRGAANALDLDLGRIEHSEDRYWHAAPVHDRLRIEQPPVGESRVSTGVTPRTEYMGIEENPKVPAERGPRPCKHAELFHFLRKGFDSALLEIRVQGVGNRTIGPMVVNRDAGHGVGIFGRVPDGVELIFSQEGRVLLDGDDVTGRAYAWQGACFAASGAEPIAGDGASRSYGKDFVFADAELSVAEHDADGRTSRFALVTPAGTLDREALLPHAGESLPMPTIGVGKTRFAFFVQHGHFSALLPDREPPPAEVFADDPFASTPEEALATMELLTPRYGVGFADAALLADRAGGAGETAGKLHLRWLERQAYSVRLLIPNRFRAFDDADGATVKEHVKNGIRRFRPAGIHVDVDFVEEDWVLGEAELPQGDEVLTGPIDRIRSHTLLEPVPEEA